jgi:hypothetical protein
MYGWRATGGDRVGDDKRGRDVLRVRAVIVAGALAVTVAAGLIAHSSGRQAPAAAPRSPGAGTPGSPAASTPGSPAAGTPRSPEAGTPGSPEAGTPGSPEAGATAVPATPRQPTGPAGRVVPTPASATSIGRGTPKSTAQRTTPPVPPAARPSGDADDPAPLPGVLRREDRLPEGVPDQVAFFFGGGPPCGKNIERPDIDVTGGLVIPTTFELCFYGFDAAAPLRIDLAPPTGRPVTTTLTFPSVLSNGFWYRWPRLPTDPAGRYRISARQGDTVVTESFAVVVSATPRLWLDAPYGGVPVGDDVHMYLSGFPPDRTLALNLYDVHDDLSSYRTSFPARVDGRGVGHVVLRTAPGDPLACWGVSHPDLGDSPIVDDGAVRSRNVFCTVATDE